MVRAFHFVLAALVALALSNVSAAQKKKPAAPTAAGTVKAVDASAGTITLAGQKTKKGEEPEQTIAVAKDAKVSVDGESKTLADVKAGVRATLGLTSDRKTALSVTVGSKKKK
jgi:hypothetical protein